MQVHTKKHPTKQPLVILRFVHQGHVYDIPKKVADKYEVKSDDSDVLPAREFFATIEKKFTKAGVLLRGTRHREGLTQAQMAKKINVTQADLSKMESGKRSIGKVIAKRIEKLFGVNYRYFL